MAANLLLITPRACLNLRRPQKSAQACLDFALAMAKSATSTPRPTRGLLTTRSLHEHETKGKGKRSTVKLEALPQGIVDGQNVQPEQETSDPEITYPTVIQQAKDHMIKYDGCVLLTRVGNFYELYFEQAKHWGVLLGLKVAYRKTNKRASATPVPMAGFPFFQLDRYLKTFVHDHGQKVAIAEEVANDPSQRVKAGGLMFDRQVKRIVTPGTLIDETFLSPALHNYLLAVHIEFAEAAADPAERPVGLSWIDLSSGDFSTQSTTLSSLSSAIARINPREVLFEPRIHGTVDHLIASVLAECGPRTTYYDAENSKSLNDLQEDKEIDPSSLSGVSRDEIPSLSMLLSYVGDQLPGLKLRFLRLTKYEAKEHMDIDRHTLRGLEILQTMRDGVLTGSLLHTIQRTVTWSGARLLAERLKAPSTSIKEINDRLDLVHIFLSNEDMLEDITSMLRNTTDSFRILQSVACGKGDSESLLSLSRTIILTGQIADSLQTASTRMSKLGALVGRFQLEGPMMLSERILTAIDEDALVARNRQEDDDAAQAAGMAREAISAEASGDLAALSKRLSSRKFTRTLRASDNGQDDIWVMRRSASRTLTMLHSTLDGLYLDKARLEADLRTGHGVPSLTLRMTPGLGYIAHVTGKDTKGSLSTLESARTVGASKSTRSYYLPEWTKLGKSLDETRLRIRSEEQQIFKDLREGVCNEIVALRRNASVLDELDVACSSAALAAERDLVRPILDDSTSMAIVSGRHVTVEASLDACGRSFTPNDCFLGLLTGAGEVKERIQLITGPNMAGKSTYLRQVALLCILAQTGLYVPAAHATIGIADAVFSRIGAADNLYNDQSTFMVEMIETAAILKGATSRSLVVMDEVGRGTTPEDGVAVGFAVLDSLRTKGVGRVLFATHFHRLADPDMCAGWPEVGCWSTRVVDERLPDGTTSFRFVHKMARGVNRESHALKVAKLAGIPETTIEVAARVLQSKM